MPFTVLIADDEQLERDALRAVVDRTSDVEWVLLSAATGTEAVDLAMRYRIDLAFLDIAMPGRSGLEVAEAIRSGDGAGAIVFVTAFDYFEYARTALRLHAEDYLVKPVEDDAVARIVRRVHDRWVREQSPGAGTHDGGSGDTNGAANTDITDRERMTELIRFLELELLDDLIAGDGNRDDLMPAFGLLGISRIQGAAIVVKPALEEYPFRLETAGQRRTVVQRVLRVVSRPFTGDGSTVLARAHDDIGYVIVLTPEAQDPRGVTVGPGGKLLARIADIATETVSIPVRLEATAPFRDAPELSLRIREARHRLFNPGGAAPPVRQELHPEAAVERRILKALIDNDVAGARRGGEELWGLLVTDGDMGLAGLVPGRGNGGGADLYVPTDRVVRDRANRSLSFLARTLRAKGLTVPSDTDILLDEAFGDRRGLHVEFIRRIVMLRDRSDGIPDDGVVRRVREFLQAHYCDEIGLADVAGYLGLSESHCSREISRRFGVSFSHLLREFRLRVARRLLAEESLTVREVADGAGFRDANYFSRVFHREYGMSPREYRRTLV